MKKKIRFKGNDRFLMFLIKDVRRRWMQYGENREVSLKKVYVVCKKCYKRATEWDHIEPVGKRPYTIEGLVPYIKRMILNKCQPLCKDCNKRKGMK